MAHEILSIKLCQLDDRVEKLHSRIHLSENASPARMQQEIERLKRECAESEAALRESLQRSKACVAPALARGYQHMEALLLETQKNLQKILSEELDPESAAEEKVLLAEYALDLAQQAADRALLLSMEAINAQLLQQQEGRIL